MQTIVDTADGADALWMNQLYSIASGGDFWGGGGQLSTAGSSTGIELSLSQVVVNIGGETVKHGSQPVPIDPTSGEYRTDVVYATDRGIEVQKGQEMAKAPGKDHPDGPAQFPSIWQPTPNDGSLISGVPLWCVHVTPTDNVSNDIGSWQWQDRRMNAETISTDAVVALLDKYDAAKNGSIGTTVANSEQFAGHNLATHRSGITPMQFTERISKNSFGYVRPFQVPSGLTLHLDRWGRYPFTAGSPSPGVNSELQLLRYTDSGKTTEKTVSNPHDSIKYSHDSSGETFAFRLQNLSVNEIDITATVWMSMYPTP